MHDGHDDPLPDLQHAVVLACGGDPSGDEAVRFAIREARLRHALLVVVTTYQQPIDPDLGSFDRSDSELRALARDRAEAALARAVAGGVDQVPEHQTVASCGTPGRVLVRDFSGAELVVVGSHHRHLLGRMLHGESVSAELIHHGRVPVVVVPPAHLAAGDLDRSG
jgi:nucleotide-binding universal stress UspA family protein